MDPISEYNQNPMEMDANENDQIFELANHSNEPVGVPDSSKGSNATGFFANDHQYSVDSIGA